jgi:hypothetical protein
MTKFIIIPLDSNLKPYSITTDCLDIIIALLNGGAFINAEWVANPFVAVLQ